MSPQHFHETLPINQDDFMSTKIKCLSFDVPTISQAITSYIKNGTSERQEDAKENFQSEGLWNLDDPENRTDIRRYFELFDDAYFGGQLSKNDCRIDLLEKSAAVKRFEGATYMLSSFFEVFRPGEERNTRYRIREPWVKITIVQDKSDGNPFERIQRYQTALLLEMIHAMFLLHTCVCEHGCYQKLQNPSFAGAYRLALQAVTKAIEDADKVGGALFGFGTDLARNEWMAQDMDKGSNLPDEVALRSVGLDICEILRYRDEIRQEKDRGKREAKTLSCLLKGSSCLRQDWEISSF